MAIFPNLAIESIVQVGDKTRLNASGSFVSKDSPLLEKIEIDPNADGWIDVTSDGFLDWEYSTSGAKAPKVRVTVVGGGNSTKTYALTVKTLAEDNLFSNDEDLQNHEPDILKWVRDGRNSYLDLHRRAQELILDTLYRLGYTDTERNRLTPAAVVDIKEVKEWSSYTVLHLIFNGISNAVDDVFAAKAKLYKTEAEKRMTSTTLKLDLNADSELTPGETRNMMSIWVERR
jgi:hypothetical protein